jgi:hypothetical protein
VRVTGCEPTENGPEGDSVSVIASPSGSDHPPSTSSREFEIALIHIGLGDIDQAIEWLEKAYNKRDPFLLYLKVEPQHG